jgi:hypothetical protein
MIKKTPGAGLFLAKPIRNGRGNASISAKRIRHGEANSVAKQRDGGKGEPGS